MPPEHPELTSRSAEQHEGASWIALPAAQTSAAPSPESPLSFAPDTFYDLPRPRTLGRVRMPIRAIFLAVIAFALIVAVIVALRLSGIREDLGPSWFYIITLVATEVLLILLWVWLPSRVMRRHNSLHLLKWRRPRRADLLSAIVALALMAAIWVAFVELADWGGWWWTVRTEPPEGWTAFPKGLIDVG